MAKSDFQGAFSVIIRDNKANTFASFVPLNVGSDGLDDAPDINEVTIDSMSGGIDADNGINLHAVNLTLLPTSVEMLGKIFPNEYDATTGSWGYDFGGCNVGDADIAIVKQCDSKATTVYKHVSISPVFEYQRDRDDVLTVQISFYPNPSPKSEYGVTGDKATQVTPFLVFDGTYDPSTGTITFDTGA